MRGAPQCAGNGFSRRGFLAGGMLGGFGGLAAGSGMCLADLLFAQKSLASDLSSPSRAKSVIHIFLPGGWAQQETFDPKPYAPIEYRGDLGHIRTVTGEHFGSSVKQLAKIADKFTVIRSMTHTDAAHERGIEHMFTGYPPSPALTYPSVGSVVSHELGPRNNLPAYVCIPKQPNPSAANGYLSSAYAPFSLGSDPAKGDFRVRDLDLPKNVDAERFARRRELLADVNATYAANANTDNVHAMNTFYERAYGLLDSVDAREAFDINKEDAKVRDRYGRNEAGQRLLMARRLVEAGVRLVTLTYGAWDMHQRLTQNMRRTMPSFDKALAALINDLDASGRLDETLIVVSSEFGRTPKINKDAGRDHWPRVFNVLLAGGGVQRGMIYGASNATAAEPENLPVSPADLTATIYHQLGIDFEKELMASGGRPIEIVKGGQVLSDILA